MEGTSGKRPSALIIGIDVGSTTVKCVAIEPLTHEILWRRYERHEGRQAEKVAEMLAAIGVSKTRSRAYPRILRRFFVGR